MVLSAVQLPKGLTLVMASNSICVLWYLLRGGSLRHAWSEFEPKSPPALSAKFSLPALTAYKMQSQGMLRVCLESMVFPRHFSDPANHAEN